MAERRTKVLTGKREVRENRNIGPVIYEQEVGAQDAILLVERLLKNLLQTTTNWLKDDEDACRRFFSHFFDSTVTEEEREEFVTNFTTKPPKTILGYARSAAQYPCFSIVTESEEESENVLGDYLGLDPDDAPVEYTGSIDDATYAIYVYSGHPEVTLYLYQYGKAVAHAGKKLLLSQGVLEARISGGELGPEEVYLPDNTFVRVIRVHTKQTFSVPRILLTDPILQRITGLYVNDINVDGIQGGVVPVTITLDED